jgi:hypothetical protein
MIQDDFSHFDLFKVKSILIPFDNNKTKNQYREEGEKDRDRGNFPKMGEAIGGSLFLALGKKQSIGNFIAYAHFLTEKEFCPN